MTAIINFDHVNKKYGKQDIIKDLSFSINQGEFITILGASGSGKTTTLKMINGLEKPNGGKISVLGQDLSQSNLVNLRRQIGYVVQSIGLFPHMTVGENIAVTPKLLKWDKKKIQDRVSQLLDLVNLDQDFASRYPGQLSGGQQQRVGVARALAADPDLLLFDEPFSALDAITKQDLQKSVKKLHQQLPDKTFFFVTHDINEALFLGDRVMVLNNGQIEQFAQPEEIVKHPQTSYVKRLLETVTQNLALWEDFDA
ncbi:MAG: ABC transporter ATP-binding protein [Lactobacillus equicursoris]|uniref:ABC transporter ATP-binding protein n=1 Tax=Lactobacillus equicursoris TaxID=420645 RepID=UPI002432D0B3|nr:ABC transporter ATP-binding protein [Lactobacillus equicursoris]MDD6407069.1 ABC transporter ATP-binding protein [Lactobacillus equicursoris]